MYNLLFMWVALVLVVGVVMEGLSYGFTSVFKEKSSVSTFECGFDAFDSSSEAYELSFYVVGMLFMVMDVEALFLYPWVSSWWVQGGVGVGGMLDFLLELVICLVVVWYSFFSE